MHLHSFLITYLNNISPRFCDNIFGFATVVSGDHREASKIIGRANLCKVKFRNSIYARVAYLDLRFEGLQNIQFWKHAGPIFPKALQQESWVKQKGLAKQKCLAQARILLEQLFVFKKVLKQKSCLSQAEILLEPSTFLGNSWKQASTISILFNDQLFEWIKLMYF